MAYTSLIEFLAAHLAHRSDVACVDRNDGYRAKRSTYGDVAGIAAQVARELESRGIQEGDRVLLWGEIAATGLPPSLDASCEGSSPSRWIVRLRPILQSG